MTPGRVHREGWRWFPTAIIISLLLAGFIVVAQHFGFWLDTQNVKHQGKIQQQQYQNNQDSGQYQTGWYTKLSDDYNSMLADEETEGLASQGPPGFLENVKAAVLGDAGSVCYDYTQVDQSVKSVPADIISWYKANCSGTAVSLSSELRK